MIELDNQNVKLQIWDTVNIKIFRLDKNHSSLLQEGIIDQHLQQFSFMILQIDNRSKM